jgi:hypothetical protein
MKTYLSGKIFILLSFLTLSVLSCKKKEDTTNQTVVPPVTQTPAPIGAILDSGIVSSTTRVMKMDLNTQNFVLYGSGEEVSYAPAKVQVSFYVNNDGSIPSGEYSFSNDATKAPFTFGAAALVYVMGSDSSSPSSDPIVSGTIDVNKQGGTYVFSLQIGLASGLTASQIYSGPLNYSDTR